MLLFSLFCTQKHHEGKNRRDGRTYDYFHCLSTKDDMLLLIGEAKYMLVFGHSERELVEWKTPNMLYNEDSPLNSYVTLTVHCR